MACAPPACAAAGQALNLTGACQITNGAQGAVAYYDAAGRRVTRVTCPAAGKRAPVIEPQLLGAGGCFQVGPKFAVAGAGG